MLNLNYKIVVSNNTDRKQDAEYVRRKKSLIASRMKNQTIRIVRSRMAGKQDHSTLLNSTEVWREKCRIHDPVTSEPKKLQYIKDVPRLYVFFFFKEEGMFIFIFTFINLYLNISSLQIRSMEKQGICGD